MSKQTKTHYNDWPNTKGFDVTYQELEPTELQVTGTIPEYACGVLFRNGLGPRDIADTNGKTVYRVSHWFDNLSQVHRFQMHPPTPENPAVRVTHNSRLTCDELIQRVKQTGRRDEVTFGAKRDPCQTFFEKAQSFFKPTMPNDTISGVGIGVAFSARFPGLPDHGSKQPGAAKRLAFVNKSDMAHFQELDPETLEPIGIVDQSILHEDLKGPISAAHACVDLVTGDFYNFNLAFGPRPAYRVFTTSPSTGKTTILATVRAPPAYLHSFFLTEHYVVLCVWNSHFTAAGASLLMTRNFVDSMAAFDKSKPATWYVIDRTETRKGVVATYQSNAFFCFHSINAYEEPNPQDPTQVDIVLDAAIYENLNSLKQFYIDNLLSDSASALPYVNKIENWASFRRYRLPSLPSKPNTKPLKAAIDHTGEKGYAPELPSIHPQRVGQKHRYAYGTITTGKSTFVDGLVKLDCDTWEQMVWTEHAQTPSEPIFVPDPARLGQEDAGVLLTVVLDGAGGKSYLLVLDAETMKEVACAKVEGVVGFGFHGLHVPASIAPTANL